MHASGISSVHKRISAETMLALTAGVILALMIAWNSLLAHYSTPIVGSWATHGVGTLASIVFLASSRRFTTPGASATEATGWPRWIYLGGVAGAVAVLLTTVTVNGPLGLAGTLALMLAGQLVFTIAVDRYGWFSLEKRPIRRDQLLALALIGGGSVLIIGGYPL